MMFSCLYEWPQVFWPLETKEADITALIAQFWPLDPDVCVAMLEG